MNKIQIFLSSVTCCCWLCKNNKNSICCNALYWSWLCLLVDICAHFTSYYRFRVCIITGEIVSLGVFHGRCKLKCFNFVYLSHTQLFVVVFVTYLIYHWRHWHLQQLIILWWAGKPDKGALGDSGVSTATEADSHDDSIAVEGDKLVIRPPSLPAAAAAELSANDRVRYYHISHLCYTSTINLDSIN